MNMTRRWRVGGRDEMFGFGQRFRPITGDCREQTDVFRPAVFRAGACVRLAFDPLSALRHPYITALTAYRLARSTRVTLSVDNGRYHWRAPAIALHRRLSGPFRVQERVRHQHTLHI